MSTTFSVSDSGELSSVTADDDLTQASAHLPQGAYTTLRTYAGDRVLALERHVHRLEESVSPRRPLAFDRVRRGLSAAVVRLGFPESRFRLTFAPPALFIAGERFRALPEAAFRDGGRAVTVAVRRANPEAKDTRFIATAASLYATLPAGVNEGLMLAEDDALLEGLSSNFFAIAGGVLRTEDARVLKGVTRALVLETAASLVAVELRPVRLSEIPGLQECFLTSVSREVLPLVAIDGQVLGDGRPGPITRALIARFAALVAKESVALRA